MSTNALELQRLASRIADGEPLDWAEVAPKERYGLLQVHRVAVGFRQAIERTRELGTERKFLFKFCGMQVIEKLGEGSSGEVFRAYDPMLDQYVALKLRKSDSRELSHSFAEEARRLARLRHPNILNVYGAAVEDRKVGIWTELVQGSSLAKLLAAQGKFSVSEVRNIGRDLCHAIACIHRSGIVHGDIKPENIMWDDFGRIILMDFGAARECKNTTAEWALRGSVRYLPPEVLRGGDVSPSIDIYALGVTLFRLLSGCHPYAAADLSGLMNEQEHGHCRSLQTLDPKLPRDFCKAIERAIDTDPKERHRSALAFATALEASPKSSKKNQAWRWIAVASFAVLAIVPAIYTHLSTTGWTANVSFYRSDINGRQVLADGDGIELGDSFGLELQGTQPVYLYVLDDDGSHQPAVLFPADDIAAKNPLSPAGVMRLPGKGTDGHVRDWQVNTDATSEQFIVIAAIEPQIGVEEAIANWRKASLSASVATNQKDRLRGAYGLVQTQRNALVPRSSIDQVLSDIEDLQAKGKVRYWQFSFRHRDHATAIGP